MTKKLLSLLATLALSLIGSFTQAEEPYRFGVLNQAPAAETAALWNPILTYLEKTTGHPFRFAMGPTVQDTDAATARGEYDFVFSNHVFDSALSQAHYYPLVQLGGHPLIGQIVVREDSEYKTLQDLAGKQVAFPSQSAFIAYKVTRYALKEAEVTIEPVFAASQDGAAVQLSLGRVVAASLNKLFADKFRQEGKGKFRVLYESEAWPNIPVLVHPRVPDQHVLAVQKALLQMSTDPAGKAVLEKIKHPGFTAVKDSDYTATRRLYPMDF